MSKKQFKAQSKRLLDLMINSVYTHKEIFLREIISNASDALDKLCYKALTDETVGMARADFAIQIIRDEDGRTLTISDNGIGMTKEELENNLGTIAKSGSLDFKQGLADEDMPETEEGAGKPIDVIGQFGVGFYSAFMVSDKVRVVTKAYGSEEAWAWESEGADGYTISPAEKAGVGTDIIMQIKPDGEDENYSRFLQEHGLSALVRKYSDYIRYPIQMEVTRSRPVEKPEGESEEQKSPPEMESYTLTETLNSMVPIWQRNKNEVTADDLSAFYAEKFHDFEPPVKSIQVDAEGAVSYKALLFVPARAGYDYYTKDYQRGLALYSSGVLIMDKCGDLVSEHFRFVRGVVDSPDLSLNISRELLQHDRQLKVIAGNIEKKIRNELLKLQKDERESYEKFFAQFGLQLKYGMIGEFGKEKDSLKDLLLFASSESDKLTTLAEYRARMKDEQKDIYYATGESAKVIEALPQAERLREKGYEILYFTHEVDEFVAQTLREYDEKPLKSVNRDELGLESEEEKQAVQKQEEESGDLLTFVKEAVGGSVGQVKLSHKLRSQPVCLTAGGGLSFEMEKYLSTIQPDGGVRADRILELNAEHPVFERLKSLQSENPDKAKDYAKILYHQAALMAGLPVEDPTEHAKLIFKLME
ncbi:MAG: molecular chaperone HtpG [Oscillospiraceae bacterium]|nr:molecular chaperone HtpG [Oscillospiraceae bacterium]